MNVVPANWLRAVFGALIAVVVTGCSVTLLPEKQALRIFTLPYGYSAGAEGRSSDLPILKVVRPRANGILSGKRMVIETRPNELAAYDSARWVTDAPALLRDHVVRALRDDARFTTVVADTSGSVSDVSLTLEMLAFQEVRSGDSASVRIFLQAQLIENGSRRTLATRDFDVRSDIAEGGIETVVTAFGKASDQLSGELAEWALGELADY